MNAEPVPARLLRVAREHPEASAVVAGGTRLTYADLVERAASLARHLTRLGVGPETRVGVFLDRDALLPGALAAVHLAGGAYVPVDPGYPADRTGFILTDCAAPVVLTTAALRGRLPDLPDAVVVAVEELPPDGGPVPATVDLDDHRLAYVIYTSGSTGRPKGVMVEHGSLARLLTAMAERPGLTAGQRMLGVTTPAFDLSVPDLFLPGWVGGTLVLAPAEQTSEGARLLALVRDSDPDVLQATPSTWRMLLDAGWEGSPRLRAVVGGEACPAALAARLAAHVGELWNFYGPTEATVWTTCALLRDPVHPLPLGAPVAGLQVHVVDADLADVPDGTDGELLIGGPGLARGYLHRPELTAERFLELPGRGRVYRTGDLVRREADGALVFRGRIDHQVKLRGFRIELGEVEAVLLASPGVREAVVVLRPDTAGEDQLVGYLGAPDGVDARTVWATAAARLPGYMVPGMLVVLPALPQTPNGKIDRAALPPPSRDSLATEQPYTAPRTPVEEVLVDLWRDVLEVDRVGVHDDFFELGGQSLRLTRLATRMSDALGVTVPLRRVFELRTVAALAVDVVEAMMTTDQRSEDLDEVLARLEAEGVGSGDE